MPEEILLDEDEEAKAHDFYMVGGVAVSDDDSRLAYSEDVVGAEKFKLTIVDLATGKRLLSGEVANTSGQIVWAADNRTILYVLLDKTLRPYKARFTTCACRKQRLQRVWRTPISMCTGLGRAEDGAAAAHSRYRAADHGALACALPPQ